MTQALLELLQAMKSHAERERQAVRNLQPRQLFELATEGEGLAQRLKALLATISPEEVASPAWAEVRSQAHELRALSRANAELVRRSLDVVRAVKAPGPAAHDAPAFVSRVA